MEIVLDSVTKRIKKATVLEDVSMTLHSGVIYGLRGENGSGKTMLMRIISGLIIPTSGTVTIDGSVLHRDISFPKSIGMLLENPAFISDYTAYENLRVLADLQKGISEEEIRDVIGRVGLDPDDKRKFRKFSLGMKQRLGIAAAIMGDPDIIILDEPFNAIDEAGVNQIKKLIIEERDKDRLVIVACHDKESFDEMADEVYRISEGRIVG